MFIILVLFRLSHILQNITPNPPSVSPNTTSNSNSSSLGSILSSPATTPSRPVTQILNGRLLPPMPPASATQRVVKIRAHPGPPLLQPTVNGLHHSQPVKLSDRLSTLAVPTTTLATIKANDLSEQGDKPVRLAFLSTPSNSKVGALSPVMNGQKLSAILNNVQRQHPQKHLISSSGDRLIVLSPQKSNSISQQLQMGIASPALSRVKLSPIFTRKQPQLPMVPSIPGVTATVPPVEGISSRPNVVRQIVATSSLPSNLRQNPGSSSSVREEIKLVLPHMIQEQQQQQPPPVVLSSISGGQFVQGQSQQKWYSIATLIYRNKWTFVWNVTEN